VKTLVDERFAREVSVYRLRFRCEDCAHFVVEGGRCGNGYPVEPHLERPLDGLPALEFCKEFELV
jgi:hypothetical protein